MLYNDPVNRLDHKYSFITHSILTPLDKENIFYNYCAILGETYISGNDFDAYFVRCDKVSNVDTRNQTGFDAFMHCKQVRRKNYNYSEKKKFPLSE